MNNFKDFVSNSFTNVKDVFSMDEMVYSFMFSLVPSVWDISSDILLGLDLEQKQQSINSAICFSACYKPSLENSVQTHVENLFSIKALVNSCHHLYSIHCCIPHGFSLPWSFKVLCHDCQCLHSYHKAGCCIRPSASYKGCFSQLNRA